MTMSASIVAISLSGTPNLSLRSLLRMSLLAKPTGQDLKQKRGKMKISEYTITVGKVCIKLGIVGVSTQKSKSVSKGISKK